MKRILLNFCLLFTCSLYSQQLNWVFQLGDNSDNYGNSIVYDNNGYLYAVGSFKGTADFDPGPGVLNLNAQNYRDAYLAKYDTLGNFIWARNIPADIFQITLDPQGNICVGGTFKGTVDLDPGTTTHTYTSSGGTDGFVAKFNPSGIFVWATAFGGTLNDNLKSITCDNSGNLYTTGSYHAAKFDFNGNLIWTKNFTLSGADVQASSILYDVTGHIYRRIF
jgi:hypothetical protein